MQYRLLPWILEQEGADFQRIENRWRPTQLLMLQQVRALLRDMSERYEHLLAAHEELQTLIRGDRYARLLQRMRLWLRMASFKWKADQLAFLQAASGFYSDYGIVLRLLRNDRSVGLLGVLDSSRPLKGV